MRASANLLALCAALVFTPPALAQTPFDAPPAAEADLKASAGREDTNQHANADQVAGVSKNTIGDNSTTGQVLVADNAFQNMSGLSVLNVNTGNNVAINAAMNVNIAIIPQP